MNNYHNSPRKERGGLNKIILNGKMNEILLMIAISFWVATLVFYICDIYLISVVIKYNIQEVKDYAIIKSIKAYTVLTFIFGAHASIWLFLTFTPTHRIMVKKWELKILSLLTLNFLSFYCIELIKKYHAKPKETFSSIIMTNDSFFDKNKNFDHWMIIFSSLFAFILLPPLGILIFLVISESRHTYLEDFDIRSKISVFLLSLFYVFSPFSIYKVINLFSNPMVESWIQEYEEGIEHNDTYKNKKRIDIIFDVAYLLLVILTIVSIVFMTRMFAHHEQVRTNSLLTMLLWIYVSVVGIINLIFMRLWLDLDRTISPIWIFISIITLNFISAILATILIFSDKEKRQRHLKRQIKLMIDKTLSIPLLISVFVFIGAIALTLLAAIHGQNFFKFEIIFTKGIKIEGNGEWMPVFVGNIITLIFIVDTIWIFSNVTKTFSYYWYIDYAKIWLLFDILTLNIPAILAYLFIMYQKKKMIAEEKMF